MVDSSISTRNVSVRFWLPVFFIKHSNFIVYLLFFFYNMFSINEYYFSGYTIEFLDILSIIAVLFGITVIINKNPIGSLLFLIGLFASISVYLILSGLTFIGFSYLIVYIGAVSILFLFILMLINIRTSELQSNNINSIPLALFIGILWNYSLYQLLPYTLSINTESNWLSGLYSNINFIMNNNVIDNSIMFVTSNNWDGTMTETSHISTIGNILYTSYNMWLFLASIILLLAMVGAIIITIKQENK